MDYLLLEGQPFRIYIIFAAILVIFNLLNLGLQKILFPWQVRRLLRKWKIVLKNRQKLPLLSQLQELVVNLSGTISYGVPQVTDIYPNGISSARLLALAAAIETGIHHPIAEAIVEEAHVRGLDLPDVSTSNPVNGRGAEALMNRQTLSVGSADFFQEQGIDIPAEIYTKADQLAYKGQIIVFVAIGKFCRGFITLQDKLKRSIPGDISFLQETGIKVTIMSGSNRSTAKSYLKASGADVLRSQLSNLEKAKEMLLKQATGQVVAAAGRTSKFEGALRSCDLSFALEYAQQSVKDMADVLIHTNSIGTIATAKNIAIMVKKRQRTSWIIALLVNVLLLLSLLFLCNLDSIPNYGGLVLIGLSLVGFVVLLANQIPLRY